MHAGWRLSIRRSIFIKFSLAFILVGPIPIASLGYWLLDSFSTQAERYNTSNLEQMMLYLSKNSNQVIDEYDNLSKLMYTNPDRYNQLYDVLNATGVTADAQRNTVMDDFLKTIISSDRYIQNALFIDGGRDLIYTQSRQSKLFEESEFRSLNWGEEAKTNLKGLSFFSTHPEQYYFGSKRQVVTFARNLIDKSTTLEGHPHVLGTLYFDVDLNVFVNLLADINLNDEDIIRIETSSGTVVYENHGQDIGRPADPRAEEGDPAMTIAYDQPISSIGLMLKGRFSKQEMNNRLSQFQDALVFALGGCIVLLVALAIVFSRRFTKPILNVIRQMTKMESGNLNIQVPVKSEDEIGQLAHGFNRMAKQLEQFIKEAYLAEIRNRQSELNALKSQIRPHYLYNTLEVIRMCAVTSDNMRVADMIHSLSNQLKYVLDYGEDLVTLAQEMDHVQNYFRLIRIRFDDTIQLEINMDEDIPLSSPMLKLSIQPLIENAVQHGILPNGGWGKIRVNIVRTDQNRLTVTVIDDGIGMEESKLHQLSSYLKGLPMDSERLHVGLKNVHDRLSSLFGHAYGLAINSIPYVGTSVRFSIPLVKEETDHAKRSAG
ncbi:sensor histidine kinase [Paenibacillus sepulcri]|uniref:Sensor histidine kinase n=1 Tax=Paenibacillus sepulcri TaxID=359917 RepID=A0ABS7C2X2_9BACL|nr:sensor histidine kinase [Paenibacillus sepulcri]